MGAASITTFVVVAFVVASAEARSPPGDGDNPNNCKHFDPPGKPRPGSPPPPPAQTSKVGTGRRYFM